MNGHIEQLLRKYVGERHFTPLEMAELANIADGLPIKESANRLEISEETVRARRKKVYRKLGVDGSRQLQANLLHLAIAQFPSAP